MLFLAGFVLLRLVFHDLFASSCLVLFAETIFFWLVQRTRKETGRERENFSLLGSGDEMPQFVICEKKISLPRFFLRSFSGTCEAFLGGIMQKEPKQGK